MGAFFSTGSIGGFGLNISDLMRDYTVSIQISYFGGLGLANSYALFSSRKGRPRWNVGAYNIVQSRLDTLLLNSYSFNTYLHHEAGGVFDYEYPLNAFSFLDLGARLANVDRTHYSDASLAPLWQTMNPGNEFMIAPVLRLGFDQVLYEAYAGPIRGYGVMLESEVDFFPNRQNSTNSRVRLDLAYYLQPSKDTVLAIESIAGASWGGAFKNSFFLLSDDIFRGYPIYDPRLYGDYVLGAKLEFRFPIGDFFRFPLLRGILGIDYGSIFTHKDNFISNIASSYTTGLNLNIPPLSIAFLGSFPDRTAPGPPIHTPVIHFLLRYLYL